MSKIGKQPISIPEDVVVDVNQQAVRVKGPKGELEQKLTPKVKVAVSAGQLMVEPVGDSPVARQMWGLTRTLIANMIIGVTEGFKKDLELVGIGFRAEKKDWGISLSLGFSHPVEFEAPEGIEFEVVDKNKITVSGIDKQLVGQTAAKVRSFRPPEPYKGKGVRYAGEEMRKKPGKAGKVGAAFGTAGVEKT